MGDGRDFRLGQRVSVAPRAHTFAGLPIEEHGYAFRHSLPSTSVGGNSSFSPFPTAPQTGRILGEYLLSVLFGLAILCV